MHDPFRDAESGRQAIADAHAAIDRMEQAARDRKSKSGDETMTAYATKTELVSAWQAENPNLHKSCCPWKYVPHLYRGGYVIPGFGFSVERVGRFVAADRAGSPYEVGR